MKQISDSLEEGAAIITGSSGLAIESFYVAFRNKAGQRVMHTSGLGSMGYGVRLRSVIRPRQNGTSLYV